MTKSKRTTNKRGHIYKIKEDYKQKGTHIQNQRGLQTKGDTYTKSKRTTNKRGHIYKIKEDRYY